MDTRVDAHDRLFSEAARDEEIMDARFTRIEEQLQFRSNRVTHLVNKGCPFPSSLKLDGIPSQASDVAVLL
jgi:hypothetical protein